MKPIINYSHEEFISDVQYLELIKDLILKRTDQTFKAAFYLADQFVEVMMFRLLKAQISHDSELITIFHPQIDQERITEISRYYEKKIKWLQKLEYIDSLDAEKIRFVHSYRNLSYHNEIEDSTVVSIFASLGLVNAIKLFKSYYRISSSEEFFCSNAVSALVKYSLPTDRINYPTASRIIGNNLQRNLSGKKKVEEVLKSSLRKRLEVIFYKREQLSWLKNDQIFDVWLKIAEFFEIHPYDKLSQRVYEINYEFLELVKKDAKPDSKIAAQLHKKKKLRESARDRKIYRLLTAYKPLASSRSLIVAKRFLRAKMANLQTLLSKYKELDRQIRAVEILVEIIEEQFDREVQRGT